MDQRERGVYSIGIVAQLTGLHDQTIRQYEKLGLVSPKRSAGGTRRFSENDVSRLKAISSLTRDMGVNLAGVEIILRMRTRQEGLITLINEMFKHMDEHTRSRFESYIRGDEPGLVPTGSAGLARVHREADALMIEIDDDDMLRIRRD
ncbi:MerR family transcriptional regulator [bacterium]|nr:MerR family transcriptional regulator [bacterium]